MRSLILVLAVAVLSLFTPGCQSVTTTAPVGTPSNDIAQALEGVWKINDALVHLKATATPGQMQLATIQWSKDQWKLEQHLIHVGQVGQARYVSVQPKDGEKKLEQYVFVQLLYEGDKPDAIMVVAPNFDTFKAAVESGRIKGKLASSSEIVLSASTNELAAFLNPELAGSQFKLNQPIAFTRVGVKIHEVSPTGQD